MSTRTAPQWIWTRPDDPAPCNRFHYFRKVFELESVPDDPRLRFAADTNAQVWINGRIVRRKVSRYTEEAISAENIHAGPHLHGGRNTIVVLHHNWGDVPCFMRDANRHAGLYAEAPWLQSDTSWKWTPAPEFLPHEEQIIGIVGESKRLRYPVLIDGARAPGKIHDPDFDDSAWECACAVEDGPWPRRPVEQETPGQREHPVRPRTVLAAGTAERPEAAGPAELSRAIVSAKLSPDENTRTSVEDLLRGRPCTLTGRAGETLYLTVDFALPSHGFPFLEVETSIPGITIDLGYGEIARTLYEDKTLVREDGWIDTEGVAGTHYADRYIAGTGRRYAEVPDERTLRWCTLHVTFPEEGSLTLHDFGFIKSQYPIERYGSFHCGDETVEQIMKLCMAHAEVAMTDAYVDTPGREDGQWIEDAQPRAKLAASWFNDTRLRRFLIRTFAEGQDEQGDFHPFWPAKWPIMMPGNFDWSVQWVCTLYDEYMWSGDTELVRRYWDHVIRFWNNVAEFVDEQGRFVTYRTYGDLRMGYDCTHTQSNGLVTPWLIERLGFSMEMAAAIGDRDQQGEWKQLHDRMLEAFHRDHVVPARDGVPAHVASRFETTGEEIDRGFSQSGQTVATTAGLLPRETAEAAVDYAFSEPCGDPPEGVRRWNNPTYGYRCLRTLSYLDRSERAVRHLKERFAPYLPGHPDNRISHALQGCYGGPLPEYWMSREDAGLAEGEPNPHQPHDETGSHGWCATPLLWMHDSLLGVRVLEPGGGKIALEPDSGGLPYVAGHAMTPRGGVYLYWDPQQWRLRVSIPADVRAELTLPPEGRGRRVRTERADGTAEREGDLFRLEGAGEYAFLIW
ncbi:alpha-L-rhamnosidase C-terminal domain-containing protein [Kiritimatiella glycovorans]|uniref:Alpha-L-rhamnosidase n=1 Tax=Kiritimatiella glycovorans TaxID=1307763 RepID=A0A0G3EJQ9_9BACT|nr:alpha-L-rhamnosidase C-terminal domain-containing protein [Kiritimatiella glycovorans]AKJ65682.1 Alpha-L-rhamnosidase [Kiritimatiella glycovorans]